MYRMYGISKLQEHNFVHVRYVAVPWSFLGIHAFTALMHPCTSMGNNDESIKSTFLVQNYLADNP